MARTDVIRVVEMAYDLRLPRHEWLQELCDAISVLLDQGLGTTVFEYTVDPSRSIHLGGFAQTGGAPEFREMAESLQAALPPEWVEDVYLTPGTMGSSSEVLPRQLRKSLHGAGSLPFDILGFNVSHRPGEGIVVSAPMSQHRRASPAERKLWMRVLPHLRAGLRLRANLRDVSSAPTDPIAGADAVFDETGKVVRADTAAESAQDSLRAQISAIDWARGDLRDTDPDQALNIWRGLVDGTWSLVDAFDTDGTRFVVAHRNPPHAPDPRGLTLREKQVATIVATGATNQEVGYELGMSPSTVSTLLQRAMTKLRVHDRLTLATRMTAEWKADVIGEEK